MRADHPQIHGGAVSAALDFKTVRRRRAEIKEKDTTDPLRAGADRMTASGGIEDQTGTVLFSTIFLYQPVCIISLPVLFYETSFRIDD